MNPDQEIITKQELHVLLYSFAFIVLGALASFLTLTLAEGKSGISKNNADSNTEKIVAQIIPEKVSPFENLYLRGRAAFVWDIYNQEIKVRFRSFIRLEKKFASLSDLREQIQKDCIGAKLLFNIV